MRKLLGLLFLFLMLISVSACNNDVIKEDVMSFIQEYKTEQYTIKDPKNAPTGIEIGQKVKKYLSEDVYEQLSKELLDLAAREEVFFKKLKKAIT